MSLESSPSEQAICPNCSEPVPATETRFLSISVNGSVARMRCPKCDAGIKITMHVTYSTEIIQEKP